MDITSSTLEETKRNKELFEYEMTEVILQLKGEFASLKGENIGFDPSQYEVKKPEINTVFKPAKLEQTNVNKVEYKKFDLESCKINSVEFTGTKLDVPSIQKPAAYQGAIIDNNAINLDAPEVPNVKNNAVNVDISDIPDVEKASVIEIEKNTVSVEVPEIRNFSKYENADVVCDIHIETVDYIKVSRIDPEVPVIDPIQTERVEVKKPEVMFESNIELDHADVLLPTVNPIEKIAGFVLPEVKLESVARDLVTAVKGGGNIPAVEIANTTIEKPDVKKIGTVDIVAVSREHLSVSAPEAVKMNSTRNPLAEFCIVSADGERIGKISEVSIPHVERASSPATATVEYNTVKKLDPFRVGGLDPNDIEIPEMPDFFEAIEELTNMTI